MTALELLQNHHYAKAVKAFEQKMRDDPEEFGGGSLGRAHLSLRNFDNAIKCFKRNNEIESRRTKGNIPTLNELGTALWAAGRRQDGMKEWHRAAAGILDRTIVYGDLAGGATQGLLLWYAAVTLKDDQEREYALKYLRKIADRKSYGLVLWPRPVMLMALQEKSFSDILELGFGTRTLSECLKRAQIDLLTRRHLCQALFYAACQFRESGNEVACINYMRLCSQLVNPIIDCEWYLAREEALNDGSEPEPIPEQSPVNESMN